MMKSRKKALSLALTACLAAGMAWAPARTTEATSQEQQLRMWQLFQILQQDKIERQEKAKREQEERQRLAREAEERAAAAKEKAAEEASVVPAHRLSAAEKAAFDAEHDARADAFQVAMNRYNAEMRAPLSGTFDGSAPAYYVGWGKSLFGNKYHALADNDWHYYADGTKTCITGYYYVASCPLLIDGNTIDITADSRNTKYDPAIVYINEQGKATVTCPGRYYYYDLKTNADKEADTPFYVGQVLWEGLAKKKVHTYIRSGNTSLGDWECLTLVNPHLWWNVKNPVNGRCQYKLSI